MRLTKRMLDVINSALAEAEAGGFEALTDGMSLADANEFEHHADRARAWVHEQIAKRAAGARKRGGRDLTLPTAVDRS